MKTMEVLKPHRYRGKSYKTGDTYPIARIHIAIHERMGWGKVIGAAEPVAPSVEPEPYDFDRELIKDNARRAGLSEEEAERIAPIMVGTYQTRHLEAERPKRKYTKRVKAAE